MGLASLVVGLGSPLGNDRFGWQVARLLDDRCRRVTSTSSEISRAAGPDHDDHAAMSASGGHAASDSHPIIVKTARYPADLFNWLDTAGELVLCDACIGTGHYAALRCWRWPTDELPAFRCAGTHDLGLTNTLELAARLQWLPAKVTIWGAEFDTDATDPETSSDRFAGLTRLAADRIWEQLNHA